MQPVDYRLLTRALEFYKSRGYQYIDVPWLVFPHCANVTHENPFGKFKTTGWHGGDLELVGSAEQGFIQLYYLGQIQTDTPYVSVSPCFRRGDNESPYHQETFMKIELCYIRDRDDESYVNQMTTHAKLCFLELGAMVLSTEENDGIIDILAPAKNAGEYSPFIEIGSYGTRELTKINRPNTVLDFGTGLALPRFQEII